MRAHVALVITASLTAFAASARAQSLGDRLGSPRGGPPSSQSPSRARSNSGAEAHDLERALPDVAPAPGASARPRYGDRAGLPPDLVLTQDGGMIRGTIVRSEPGWHVDIELATGEVQRVSWADVLFAGRADEAPVEPAAPPARHGDGIRATGRGVRVRFEANARLTLHSVAGSARLHASGGGVTVQGRSELFVRECTAPCVLSVDPGVYQFGLSLGDIGPVPTGALDVVGPGTLRGTHVDNSGIRLAGWLIFLAGLVGGGATIALSFVDPPWPNDTFLAGCVAAGAGLVIGIPFMAANSGVRLRFEPG